MVELQILNKILEDKSDALLIVNDITADYFTEYPEEYKFIAEHKQQYGYIPDKLTFMSKFPEFDIIEVRESEEYLVSTIREEYLFTQSVPILTKLSELMQTDSYEAISYLKSSLPLLQEPSSIKGVDIIKCANDRLEEYKNVNADKDSYFVPTGFQELDDIINGWHKGEELGVIFARTGQGKSWVTIKMLEHAWKMNQHIAMVEPEMSANKTGYRFDTLHKHISNRSLTRGDDLVGYDIYINKLMESDVPFIVLHPKDFNRKVTVSKLKAYCEANKVDMLAIDGITYLTDERKERGDNRTTQLTHISEDLMDLSIELNIPVIVVCQSNREGAKEEELQLENIRDSDGISHNASIVLSVMQKEPGLMLSILKARNAQVGAKLTYIWDIDVGRFEYVPSTDSGIDDEEQAENIRKKFESDEEEY